MIKPRKLKINSRFIVLFALGYSIFSCPVKAESDLATINPATVASMHKAYLEHTKEMEKLYLELAREVFETLKPEEKEILKNPFVRIGPRSITDIECRNLGNLAKLTYEESQSSPVLWMCMEPLWIAAELAATLNLLYTDLSVKHRRIDLSEEILNELLARLNKSADYYAKTLFDSYSFAILSGGLQSGVYCRAWQVAYLLSNNESISSCKRNDDPTTPSAKWAATNLKKTMALYIDMIKTHNADLADKFDISQLFTLDELIGGYHDELVKFIITHELAHMVSPAARPISSNAPRKHRLNVEIAADRFALERSGAAPFIFIPIAFLWTALKQLENTFHLTEEETLLRITSINTVLCEPDNVKILYTDPEDVQIVKLLLPSFCP